MVRLDRLWIGALAGVFAGLLIGIGARASMRIVALMGGLSPEFSLGGTLGILVLFTAAGIPFGVIFAGMWLLAPLRPILWGGIYGLGWAVLTAIPFLGNPGGELALASPAVGIALFAPLPFLGGLLLGVFIPWLDRRLADSKPRTIHASWLIALIIAVVLAFMSLGPLMDTGMRAPRVVWALFNELGFSFMAAREANAALGVLFTLGYIGMLVILFFLGGQAQSGRLSAVVLLIFAAGFFGEHTIFTSMIDSLRLAALAVSLMKAAGVMGLLLLLHTFPDGRCVWRWSRPLLIAMGTGSLIWYTLPAMNVQPGMLVPEALQLAAVVAVLGSGLLALAVRLRYGNASTRWQITGPIVGFVVTMLWFLGLWTALLVVPGLRFGGPGAPFAPFTVAIYLLPWLLSPLTLLHAVTRRKLWSVVEWNNQFRQTLTSELTNPLDPGSEQPVPIEQFSEPIVESNLR